MRVCRVGLEGRTTAQIHTRAAGETTVLDSNRRGEGWSSSPRHYSGTALLTKLLTGGCGSKAKRSFTYQGPSSHSTCPTAGKAVDTLSIRKFIQMCRRPGCREVSSNYSEMASRKHRP